MEGDLETVELHQFEPVAIVIHQQSQIQRQKMTTLETRKTLQQRLVRICIHDY